MNYLVRLTVDQFKVRQNNQLQLIREMIMTIQGPTLMDPLLIIKVLLLVLLSETRKAALF